MPEEVSINVTREILAGTLCCAFEGGSNYWCMIEEFVKPEKISDELDAFWHDAPHIAYPLSDGGGVIVSDRDDPDAPHHKLTLEKLYAGAQVMAEKYPRHFADMLTEDSDADTGDCLLQCALFGEEIYG